MRLALIEQRPIVDCYHLSSRQADNLDDTGCMFRLIIDANPIVKLIANAPLGEQNVARTNVRKTVVARHFSFALVF